MKRCPHVPALLLMLFAVAGCDRGERASLPAAAPESANEPVRAQPDVAASNPARASARPVPIENEANRAMLRAAEGPEVELLPCSIMEGAEYDACVATNAAAIRAAHGSQSGR